MGKRLLSIVIPARNEMFLQKTIDNILENIEGDTEIIAICDGYWPDPPVFDHERVIIVHHTNSIGQRAATNEGVRISQAKYMMKADAHCAFDKGFDIKLAKACKERDWTIIPLMYNLHGFDWKCNACGDRTYQGPLPITCEKCGESKGFKMVVVWQPRWGRKTYSWRFDKNMQFQYWRKHRKRPETRKGEYVETMSCIGACWFMERERYWEIEGLDEKHGSWGQVGVELGCKSWLSGGKMLTYKNTWFGHMFRTKNKGFSFPYPISGKAIQKARKYSQDLWLNNKWSKAKHSVDWLVDRFKPVPEWHDNN